MFKTYRRRMAIVVATASLVAMPLAGSVMASDNGGDGGESSQDESAGSESDAASHVEQKAQADVVVDQYAMSNSGANDQAVLVIQTNETLQGAESDASGGDADSIVLAEDVEGEVSATGGDGGTAGSGNASGSTNAASGGNGMATGAASAGNSSGASVGQAQTSTSANTAAANAGDDDAEAAADAGSHVEQRASVVVDVVQTAEANSGGNTQLVATIQTNGTVQGASSAANGGDALAMPDASEEVEEAVTAEGGAGGAATAANTSTSANTASGGNTMTTGAATSSNNSNVTVSQSSSNTNTNSSTSVSTD